jgi:hypothetical protein
MNENYLSRLPNDILWIILANVPNLFIINMISKYFNWQIQKIIPPKPIDITTSTSVEVIQYVNELEDYEGENLLEKKSLEKTFFHEIYISNLMELKKALDTVPYSIHFMTHDGQNRIENLVHNNIKKSTTMKSYCSSCFRDPYYLLLIITILFLLSVTLGWFIYIRTSYKIHEKPIIEKYILEQNTKLILKNNFPSSLMQMESISEYNDNIIFRKSYWDYNEYSKCFKKTNPWFNEKLCFHMEELCKNNYDINNFFFKRTHRKLDKISIPKLQNVFLNISTYECDNYHKSNNPIIYPIQYEKLKILVFILFEDNFGRHYPLCRNLNDTYMELKSENDRSEKFMILQLFIFEYNASCIAQIITNIQVPDLHIWHLIFIFCVIWIIFGICLWYTFKN